MSSQALPQELIDRIVEQLGLERDTKSLIACLTVSKAFFPMARACLWRNRLLQPSYLASIDGPVQLSLDRIPDSAVIRSLIRSMCLLVENADACWQAHSILVDAFKHVNQLALMFRSPVPRIPAAPVIGKWRIVSLKMSFFKLGLHHGAAADSCAFFEHFPMLRHLGLYHPLCMDGESTLCTAERHHRLPQSVVSLTLTHVLSANLYRIIVAGHMFSLKQLRTLELKFLDLLPEVELLLADTVKELVVHAQGEHASPFSFHHAESILFSLDTQRQARDILLWWTRVMVHNDSNNTVQKVTIEIQLHLDPEQGVPNLCFPKVWKEFGKALGGLLALKELMIIYQPDSRDRIGDTDDVATRARVTKFLRSNVGAIIDPACVRLDFIDRNV